MHDRGDIEAKEVKGPPTQRLNLCIRSLFIRSKFHLFFNRFLTDLVLRIAYRSEFLRWVNAHPCREFNDPCHYNRYDLYKLFLETEKLQGEIDYLEFGVAEGSEGSSLRWWIQNNKDPKSRFVGFDTFTGLPEDWDTIPKGTFTAGGKPPDIDDNRVSFRVGLFQDTLFGFLESFTLDRRTVINIDSDLYSSALFVLTALAPKLKKDDILIFDDFGSIRHPTHEFRAFLDFLSAYKFNYKVIGASGFYRRVALKLI